MGFLFTLLVIVIVMGLLMYGVQAYVTLPAPFKNIVLLILLLITVVWILNAAGMAGPFAYRH